MDEPAEVRNDMLKEFIVESGENLNIVEQQLLHLEQEECGPEIINQIFRAMHSVKGASGFLQLKAFETLAHLAEALLSEIREDRLGIDSRTIDLLLRCTDILKEMLQQEDLGQRYDTAEMEAELKAVLAPSAKKPADLRAGDPPHFEAADLQEALKSCCGNELYAIRVGADSGQGEDKTLAEVVRWYGEALDGLGKILHTASGGPGSQTESATLFFETILEENILREALSLPKECVLLISQEKGAPAAAGPTARSGQAKEVKLSAQDLEAPQPTEVFRPVRAGEITDRPGKGAAPPAAGGLAGQQTIRIGVHVLDELLELIGEVVLGRNQFLHTYENDVSFRNLSQSITKLHQHVIRTRMQSIGTIFEKFQRTVRDLSQKLGKKIELHIEGKEIELDRTIIEALSDPLTHLIRNAVDHGIDSVEERSALGKPTTGNIHLRAYHESGQILIEVEDDGRGIDPERVREKAQEKGLVSAAEAGRLTEKELIDFVFNPGFSTKSEATELSGRGVGMDVVKTNLELLGCAVEISSRKGRGTRVSARIPLTQAIVNSSVISCLIIRLGQYTLTIPEVAVSEIIRLSPEDQVKRIESLKGQEVFKLRDKIIPLLHLEDILDIPRTFYHPVKKAFLPDRRRLIADQRDLGPEGAEAPAAEGPGGRRRYRSLIFIVLQFKQDFFGVLVDQIVGTEEIVVKRPPSIIKNRKVFGGATILGNGTASLILDIKGMVEKAGLNFEKKQDSTYHSGVRQRKSKEDCQDIVVFNGAAEEYFAIPVNLLSEIDRFHVRDIKKVGAREFIQLHNMSVPLLRLDKHLGVSPVPPSRETLTVLIPARVQYPSGIVANSIVATMELQQNINTQEANEKGIIGTFFAGSRMITVLDIFSLLHQSDPGKYQGLVEENIQYCRILLAEDQLFFRQLITQYFRSFGIRHITLANDGREALQLLHQSPKAFDVVVSDIEMPHMNGFQLVANIKADPQLCHLPVMALTSLAGEDDVRKGMEAGFDSYEVKIDKERVIRRLDELYRQTREQGRKPR